MEEVGQMVWLRDALLWFTGAQERTHCCSEAAVKSVQREGALLLAGKRMERFDCHFWSKGNLGSCREETESRKLKRVNAATTKKTRPFSLISLFRR